MPLGAIADGECGPLYSVPHASSENAASVAGLLLTTEAAIAEKPEKKKEAVAASQKAMALKDADPKPSPEALADLEKKMAEWKAAK